MDPRPGVTPLEPEFKGGDIEVGTEAGLHKPNEVGVRRGNGHDGQRRGQPSEILHGRTVAVAISRSPSRSPSERPIGIARLGNSSRGRLLGCLRPGPPICHADARAGPMGRLPP
jgi:hypothetical protein